ncbi:Beta-barrel assembly-enhancing protease [termite gut metagenome]|uniref:Beta-barrel assembly-enhancing protease n=1 Tax=termite gut metagenome TaxID=433724 RepID=A0A5J4SW35_9ZZZZ
MNIVRLCLFIKRKGKLLFPSFFLFSLFPITAQTYQQLAEQALQYIEKDSLKQAEELFHQALKLEPANPHNALIFSNIGTLQRRMQRFDEAIESYTYALNLAPYSTPILLNRAAVYLEQGLSNRAYIDYCQTLDIAKKNVEALSMRAYIYITKRDYIAARIDYNRLLEIEPQHYNARLGLATLNQKEKKFQEAIAILEGIITDHPADATLYLARAEIEQDMNLQDMALMDIKKVIELDASSAEAFLLCGKIYLAQKKKKLAKQNFEKAITLGIPPSELHELLQQCK